MDKLKQRAKDSNHAVVASMKGNGDVYLYVNPDASEEEIAKSLTIFSIEAVKHISDTKSE